LFRFFSKVIIRADNFVIGFNWFTGVVLGPGEIVRYNIFLNVARHQTSCNDSVFTIIQPFYFVWEFYFIFFYKLLLIGQYKWANILAGFLMVQRMVLLHNFCLVYNILITFKKNVDILVLVYLGGGGLRGLVVACWTTDHNHPCSNLGVGISEGCFNFDFATLHLEVARPI